MSPTLLRTGAERKQEFCKLINWQRSFLSELRAAQRAGHGEELGEVDRQLDQVIDSASRTVLDPKFCATVF